MKTILLGLLAFVLLLGSGCKKEETGSKLSSKEKTEEVSKASKGIVTQGLEKPDGDTYSPNTFPHMTGMCACGDCLTYYWHMTTVPRHKTPCVCPPYITYDGQGMGTINPPPYSAGTQAGCNNPSVH